MHIFPMRIKFIRIIEANVKTNFSKDLTKLFNENLRIGEEFFETQNADFLRIIRLERNYPILIKIKCVEKDNKKRDNHPYNEIRTR